MTAQAFLVSNFTLYFLVPFVVFMVFAIRKSRRTRSIAPVVATVLIFVVGFVVGGLFISIGGLR